jgi:hypothetical protein
VAKVERELQRPGKFNKAHKPNQTHLPLIP